MSDHADHIVPEPHCEECARVVTAADVKRWLADRLAAAGIGPSEMPELRVERDPDDPSMVNVTVVPRPMPCISVEVLRIN